MKSSDSSVVERQPEKLKVVGSNPILDKMLYLFVYIIFLSFFSLNQSFIFDFNIFHLVLVFYSYLFCSFDNWAPNLYNTSYNLSFLLNYLLLKVRFLMNSILYFSNNLLKNRSLSSSFTLKWKPLFKKSSYFGIYRSTRNQFLNK